MENEVNPIAVYIWCEKKLFKVFHIRKATCSKDVVVWQENMSEGLSTENENSN